MIPALNEASTIGAVVTGAARFGLPIVVDDGSVDDTGGRAVQAGAVVVRHEANRGYDKAIDSGFAKAFEIGCDAVVTLDADGQHDAGQIRAFIAEIEHGADAVVGIRDRRQRVGESLFGWIAAARWGIRDPLCGMKAYRIQLWSDLGHFDSYTSVGTELVLFAASRQKQLAQLPVKTRDRDGAARFGSRLRANWRIVRALAIGLARWRRRDAGTTPSLRRGVNA